MLLPHCLILIHIGRKGQGLIGAMLAAALFSVIVGSVAYYFANTRKSMTQVSDLASSVDLAQSFLLSIRSYNNSSLVRSWVANPNIDRERRFSLSSSGYSYSSLQKDPFCHKAYSEMPLRSLLCDSLDHVNLDSRGYLAHRSNGDYDLYLSQNIRDANTWAMSLYNNLVSRQHKEVCEKGWKLSADEMRQIHPDPNFKWPVGVDIKSVNLKILPQAPNFRCGEIFKNFSGSDQSIRLVADITVDYKSSVKTFGASVDLRYEYARLSNSKPDFFRHTDVSGEGAQYFTILAEDCESILPMKSPRDTVCGRFSCRDRNNPSDTRPACSSVTPTMTDIDVQKCCRKPIQLTGERNVGECITGGTGKVIVAATPTEPGATFACQAVAPSDTGVDADYRICTKLFGSDGKYQLRDLTSDGPYKPVIEYAMNTTTRIEWYWTVLGENTYTALVRPIDATGLAGDPRRLSFSAHECPSDPRPPNSCSDPDRAIPTDNSPLIGGKSYVKTRTGQQVWCPSGSCHDRSNAVFDVGQLYAESVGGTEVFIEFHARFRNNSSDPLCFWGPGYFAAVVVDGEIKFKSILDTTIAPGSRHTVHNYESSGAKYLRLTRNSGGACKPIKENVTARFGKGNDDLFPGVSYRIVGEICDPLTPPPPPTCISSCPTADTYCSGFEPWDLGCDRSCPIGMKKSCAKPVCTPSCPHANSYCSGAEPRDGCGGRCGPGRKISGCGSCVPNCPSPDTYCRGHEPDNGCRGSCDTGRKVCGSPSPMTAKCPDRSTYCPGASQRPSDGIGGLCPEGTKTDGCGTERACIPFCPPDTSYLAGEEPWNGCPVGAGGDWCPPGRMPSGPACPAWSCRKDSDCGGLRPSDPCSDIYQCGIPASSCVMDSSGCGSCVTEPAPLCRCENPDRNRSVL